MQRARPISRLRREMWRLLRWILPLGALVLLSTIFLLSENIDPDLAVQQAGLDIEEITRQPRIGTARIAGITGEDAAIKVDADAIRTPTDPQQGGPMVLVLDQPRGQLDFASERQVDFRSESGQLQEAMNRLVMRGRVELATSDGYRTRMNQLVAALDSTDLRGTGDVAGDGPPGQITARSVTVTEAPGGNGGYLLAFRGDVRLIYYPDAAEGTDPDTAPDPD